MIAVYERARWNRRRIVGGFLLKRLFMFLLYLRSFTLFSVPNPSLCLGVLDVPKNRR